MKKHHAICPAGDVAIPFSFTVEGEEGREKIGELEPRALREMLTGQALLAYKRHRLLIQGCLDGAALIQCKSYITHTEE